MKKGEREVVVVLATGAHKSGRSRPIEWIGFVPEGFSAALSLVDLGRKVELRIEPTRRYAGRQSPETSDDFRLADGRPLWYAFLNDPNALVMAATDANRTRGELRELFRIEPDIVRQLIDGSLEEAHKVLRLTEATTGFSG